MGGGWAPPAAPGPGPRFGVTDWWCRSSGGYSDHEKEEADDDWLLADDDSSTANLFMCLRRVILAGCSIFVLILTQIDAEGKTLSLSLSCVLSYTRCCVGTMYYVLRVCCVSKRGKEVRGKRSSSICNRLSTCTGSPNVLFFPTWQLHLQVD